MKQLYLCGMEISKIQHSKNNIQLSIDEKISQWKKENRKIVKDEHGLNFYEGMTPFEKVQWIEHEIKNIKKNIEHLKKEKKEILNKRDIDYQQEFFSGYHRFVKPDMKIQNIQERAEKYVKDCRQAEITFIEKYKREYEAEIKEYEDDIKYYKQIS